MAELANILKAFGEDTRMRILRLIGREELAVGELVDALRLPQPRVSRHLGVLRRAGLAASRREGNRMYYRMPAGALDGFAEAIWRAVRTRQEGDGFFPADLKRLEKILTRRRARSREYFDAVASEWDRIKRNYIQDALPFLVVANLLGPSAVAVDVGTGTGDVLLAAASKAAKVIGVDSSDKMLAECRRRAEAAGLDNVELRSGDAEALPLADGEADTAIASMVLHHLPSPGRGLAEMARVIRPGGKVVLVDLVQHENDWAREIMADVWLGFTEQQVRTWLGEAGLADVNYSASAIDSPLAGETAPALQAFIAVATKPAENER